MTLPEYIPLNWDFAPAGPERDLRFEFNGAVWVSVSASCPELLHRTNLIGDHGTCTCEDFRYRTSKTGKPCKHLRSLNMQVRGKL